jgi:hypothetical protein
MGASKLIAGLPTTQDLAVRGWHSGVQETLKHFLFLSISLFDRETSDTLRLWR